jgi:PAS domain S-box-containing protein
MPQIEGELFQSFSDARPFGVCLVDIRGKIIYWNPEAEAITGYLGHEVLGRAYRGDLLVHCEGAKGSTEVRCPVTEVLRDGRAVAADLFLRHKQGHRVPVHVSAFALRDAMGEVRGVGEIFDPTNGKHESTGWAAHSDREFEMATGLSAVDESVVLAKTVAALLPSRNYVGCWSDWRLIAIVPECKSETLERLKSTLAGVGSSCAVKWWGDRVVVKIRAAARCVDPEKSVDELVQGLEREMKNAIGREE